MSFAIGSVICGTLRPEDLVNKFQHELRCCGDASDLAVKQLDHNDPEIVQDLIDALNEYAPPYVMFGTHGGNGADFGWWPCIESLEKDANAEDGVIKVNDLEEIPTTYTGEVMLVSDHGNVTLYSVQALEDVQPSEFTEIWSCI